MRRVRATLAGDPGEAYFPARVVIRAWIVDGAGASPAYFHSKNIDKKV